jgi:transposase
MRYELNEFEWTAIKPILPNKPRGVRRVNDGRVLNGILWVLRSGAPWRDLPQVNQQVRGPTFRRNAIARTRSPLVLTSLRRCNSFRNINSAASPP